MNDTYFEGDNVIIFKYCTPKTQDIIVCNCDKIDINIIKRVIAVGGDEIDIDFETGTITVNGKVMTEDYIKEPTLTDEGGFEYPVTVPEVLSFSGSLTLKGYIHLCIGDELYCEEDDLLFYPSDEAWKDLPYHSPQCDFQGYEK